MNTEETRELLKQHYVEGDLKLIDELSESFIKTLDRYTTPSEKAKSLLTMEKETDLAIFRDDSGFFSFTVKHSLLKSSIILRGISKYRYVSVSLVRDNTLWKIKT